LGLKWTESGYSRKNQCANAIIVSITYVDAPCCVYCDSLREINRPNVVSPLSPPYSTAPLPARVLMMSVLFVTIQIRLLWVSAMQCTASTASACAYLIWNHLVLCLRRQSQWISNMRANASKTILFYNKSKVRSVESETQCHVISSLIWQWQKFSY
jgi:hypothetical protein